MKRQNEDSDVMREESAEISPADRLAAISGASVQVRLLAEKSFQESVAVLSKPENVQQLQSLFPLFSHQTLLSGPGAQPFSLVIHALKGIIGGQPIPDTVEGSELFQRLKDWNSSNATAETKSFAENFLENEGEDPYFRPGEHMGGECENALFEWVDAALTLLTID
jgi:hypothetical protein